MMIISIGRSPNNKIVVSDSTNAVSSNHGEIKLLDNGSLFYCDKSRNGTMVNGKLINQMECSVQRGAPIIFPNGARLDWKQIPFPSHLADVKKQITIGKSPDNDIQLTGSRTSRYHAVLKITRNREYYLYDQSINGTYVNGNRIPCYVDCKVRRGDKISFANEQLLEWKQVQGAGFKPIYYVLPILLLLIALGSLWGYKSFGIVDVSKKYNNSVCLVYNSFYLAYLDGKDTLYYIGASGIVDMQNEPYKLSELQPIESTGSGFFVSSTGKIITNRHVAAPWESDLAIDKDLIQTKIGAIDASNNGVRRFNPKVIGIPVKVGIFLNGSDMNKSDPFKNLIACDFIRSAADKEVDLALIQTNNKTLPAGVDFIPNSNIITDKKQINVDDEITIIGFPLGFDLALKNSENKIKSTSNHGRVSKISDKYEIQYDAGSSHGASGSPVFNKEGKLIAVNYAGVEAREGYNFGIIATHIRNIISD